jgi:hydrogenase nickel incorporation protein HypA/HybF
VHELGITQEVVAIAAEHARGRRVVRVVLEVGKLSGVLPDAVRFCFDFCAEGTDVEGAVLEIVETSGRGRCRACAAEVSLDRPFGQCDCGNTDLEWLAGDELRVRELELAGDVQI